MTDAEKVAKVTEHISNNMDANAGMWIVVHGRCALELGGSTYWADSLMECFLEAYANIFEGELNDVATN